MRPIALIAFATLSIQIYEGAGHAFMNPNNKDEYDAAATQDAWGRIDRFFERTLRAKIPNS